MIAAANKAGKIFSVHQNRRFDIDALAMKKIADSGEIGEVINIESRIHGSRGIPSDWRGIKKYGGGMLYDWGIHIIDQACMILGYDVKSVQCSFDHITNEEVDDGFQLTIEYHSGKKAYCEVGTYNFAEMPRFYMRAKKGSAIIPHWSIPAHVVKCKAWHESDVLPVVNASGLTKTMARELASRNIQVNAIAPGAIHTAMVDSIGGPSVLQGMIDNCPCKRVGQPEDIAGAALFLASDDCTFLTGQIIKVDGGFEC